MTEFDDDELPKEQYGHLPARDPRYYAPIEGEGATTEEEEEK